MPKYLHPYRYYQKLPWKITRCRTEKGKKKLKNIKNSVCTSRQFYETAPF